MIKIETQLMNALINFSREYQRQHSFINLTGFTPCSDTEELRTFIIPVSGIKRIEKLDNRQYEVIFLTLFLQVKLIISEDEFNAKIKPIL